MPGLVTHLGNLGLYPSQKMSILNGIQLISFQMKKKKEKENEYSPTLMKVILYPFYFEKVFNSDIISQKHYFWLYTKELYPGRASVRHCITSHDKKVTYLPIPCCKYSLPLVRLVLNFQ